jgi:hypothetical protein
MAAGIPSDIERAAALPREWAALQASGKGCSRDDSFQLTESAASRMMLTVRAGCEICAT